MLYLYRGNAILLQYFRRYFHGCYLLCGNQCNYRKSKRKEDQSSDVHSCRIICSEIHFLIIYNYSIGRQITGARFFYFITLICILQKNQWQNHLLPLIFLHPITSKIPNEIMLIHRYISTFLSSPVLLFALLLSLVFVFVPESDLFLFFSFN